MFLLDPLGGYPYNRVMLNAPPSSRLRAWLESQKWSARAAAEHIGCSTSMVHKLLAGERRPGVIVACAIEAASKDWEHGPIRVTEWTGELAATGTDG